MKKLFLLFLLLSSMISAEKKTIYIQFYPNSQCDCACAKPDDKEECCCCCCFGFVIYNHKPHMCQIEIEDIEGSQINLKFEIEKKLLQDRVFFPKYGKLHFFNGENKDLDDFDLNKINVILVRQK